MRSIIITSFLASSALGLAMPQSDSPDLVKRFDVPGASEELGFIIPDNTPNGLYSVHIDSDGVAHHTRLEGPEDFPSPSEEEEDPPAGLIERQGWAIYCDGKLLNKENTDKAVGGLKWGCGLFDNDGGARIQPNTHFYNVINDVAAYFCNFDREVRHCKSWEIVSELQGRVAQTCGAYRAGWTVWNSRISIGQQWVDHRKYFCGRNH